METISEFVNSITSFQIIIPFWLKISFIIIIIVALSLGGYFMRDFFQVSYMRSGMMWFVFVAVLNLSTMLVIFLYYNQKTNTLNSVGSQGYRGKKGKMGKKGVSVTCSNCKNDLYIQSTRQNNIICTLNIYTPDFNPINDNVSYFKKIFDNGNSISYDSFVNGIILGQAYTQFANNGIPLFDGNYKYNLDSINRFKNLMKPNSIAVLLVQEINDSYTKASRNVYGTFRNPKGKVGLTSLGDTTYGGLENFKLNAFMVNGDIMYPSSYRKIVTFNIYNTKLNINEAYTIWRPIGQNITDNNGFKGAKQTFSYVALGDVCRFGTTPPDLNKIATVKNSCVSAIKSNELIPVFIYVGVLDFQDEKNNLDYTQTDTYLIQNKIANNIQLFCVWRTPINTFITNYNDQNTLENNTFIYNIYNGSYDSLNEYGNISVDSKKYASNLMKSISIDKILVAAIICKHYEIELKKEIAYYFNRFKTKVPEFANINASNASFGTLMYTIGNTIKTYEIYNEDLVRKASVGLSGDEKIIYDETKEKHLPQQILLRYNYVTEKLLTISVKIENTSNLLDIINIIFDNGIETRIAVDATGLAEGGLLLNEIQITLLMICKMLLPPTQTAYMIKDECLGTFALDRDRESTILDFTKELAKYNEQTEELELGVNKDNYKTVAPNVMQYTTLMYSQIGQLCGYIDNYQQKIEDINLEEFTTSRIKQLIKIYTQMNLYLTQALDNIGS